VTLATAWLRGRRCSEAWRAGDEEWPKLRETVGKTALLGAHFLAFAAIVHPGVDTHAMAPLLLGTASLLVHHGIVRGGGLYFDLAAIELLVAVHADLFVPSTLRLDDAVWVVLGIRAALLAASTRVSAFEKARTQLWGTATACLAVLHVCRRPWSTTGLVAAGVLAVLTALVPRERRSPTTVGERLVVALLLAMPAWLVCFGSGRWEEIGVRAALESEPLLRTLLTIFLTAVAARTAPLWAGRARPEGGAVRAAHQVRQFLEDSASVHGAAPRGPAGRALSRRPLRDAYTNPELALSRPPGRPRGRGYRRGRRQGWWVDCLVAVAALAAAIGLLRRQLLLRTDLWTYEYDLWLSLAVSATLTGLKQRLDRQDGAPEIKRPVALSILVMPAFAIFWALTHGLGSDMVLLVVGLNSVLFAFLGHERRDSPYNLVAVVGFVAFVLIVFWSKLELKVLHAYTVPVGVGVLLLLQLFEKDVKEAARARIRLTTLALMLGSAAYHALLDPRHPLAFNLALLLLCLGCMAVGSFLRVGLYVGLGLSVLLLDLASLAVKALQRGVAGLHDLGGGRFCSAPWSAAGVHRKARREEIDARLSRWREWAKVAVTNGVLAGGETKRSSRRLTTKSRPRGTPSPAPGPEPAGSLGPGHEAVPARRNDLAANGRRERPAETEPTGSWGRRPRRGRAWAGRSPEATAPRSTARSTAKRSRSHRRAR
jgi:hypothetical protein